MSNFPTGTTPFTGDPYIPSKSELANEATVVPVEPVFTTKKIIQFLQANPILLFYSQETFQPILEKLIFLKVCCLNGEERSEVDQMIQFLMQQRIFFETDFKMSGFNPEPDFFQKDNLFNINSINSINLEINDKKSNFFVEYHEKSHNSEILDREKLVHERLISENLIEYLIKNDHNLEKTLIDNLLLIKDLKNTIHDHYFVDLGEEPEESMAERFVARLFQGGSPEENEVKAFTNTRLEVEVAKRNYQPSGPSEPVPETRKYHLIAEAIFKRLDLLKLKEKSQGEKFTFAIGAYLGPTAISYIFSLDLTPEQEWEFAAILANTGACGTYIEQFKHLTQIQRFELAMMQAIGGRRDNFYPSAHNGQSSSCLGSTVYDISFHIQKFKLNDDQTEAVARIVFSPGGNRFVSVQLLFFSKYNLENQELIDELLKNCTTDQNVQPTDILEHGASKELFLAFAASRHESSQTFSAIGSAFSKFLKSKKPDEQEVLRKQYPELCLMVVPLEEVNVPQMANDLVKDLPFLEPLFKEITANENPQIRNLQLRLLGDIGLFFKGQTFSDEQIEVLVPLLIDLLRMRLPEMKPYLIKVLFKQFSNDEKKPPLALTANTFTKFSSQERLENFHSLKKLFKPNSSANLFLITLLPLYQPNQEWKVIATLLSSSEFKDSLRQKKALTFLKELGENAYLSLEEKKRTLDMACTLPQSESSKNQIKFLCQNFQKIGYLIKKGLQREVLNCSTIEDVTSLLKEIWLKLWD